MATLQNIRDFVRNYIGVDSTDLTDAILDVLIRDASHEIESAIRTWPFYEQNFTLSLTTGDNTYPLTGITALVDLNASHTNRTVYINDGSAIVDIHHADQTLKRVPHEWALDHYPSSVTTTANPPDFYSVWGEVLYFWPTPSFTGSVSLTIRAYRRPIDWVALTASSTTPDLPERLHQVLQTLALGRAYNHQDDADNGVFYLQLGANTLQRMMDDYAAMPMDAPIVVNGGPSLMRNRYRPHGRLRYPWE
jgi:hypothetical protein